MIHGDRHWSKGNDGKGESKPRTNPHETAIRRMVDRSMDLVECLHEELVTGVSQVTLIGRGFVRLAEASFDELGEVSPG